MPFDLKKSLKSVVNAASEVGNQVSQISNQLKELGPTTQKLIDDNIGIGSGSYGGSGFLSGPLGNGYVQSIIPASLAGAGIGALINAIRGKSILAGAGIGLGAGAGLGALHQTMYDFDKDYAFNNPFTKFMEWLTLPKNESGVFDVYSAISNQIDSKNDKLSTFAKNFILGPHKDKLRFNYNDLRNYLARTNNTNLVKDFSNYLGFPEEFDTKLNIPADKIRPHHLYYPAFLLRQQK